MSDFTLPTLPPANGYKDDCLEPVPKDSWQTYIAKTTFCGLTVRKNKDGLRCQIVQGNFKGHRVYMFFEYPAELGNVLYPGSQYLTDITWDSYHCI